MSTLTTDFTNIVHGRRLLLRYSPQAWINDYAVDIDGAQDIDVTEAYLKLSPAERAHLQTNSNESDELTFASMPDGKLPGGHPGPFYLDVDEVRIAAFHAPENA